MANCAFNFCINHADRADEEAPLELREVSYHLFPKEIILREKWMKQMNRDDWKPQHSSALCSLHFNKEYFTTSPDGIQTLNDDAIPTEFEITNLISEKDGQTIEAPVSCCAYKCDNTYSPDCSVTFHAFPVEQPELCAQWLTAMNCTQLDDAQAVLCSEHFDDTCFVISEENERLLIADAVPSLFLFPDDEVPMEQEEDPQTEQGSIKYEITEDELALIRRHDGVIQTLLQTQNKYVDVNAKRIRLERQKKNLDFLLRAALCNIPIVKAQVKGLRPLLKVVDGKYQEILVGCLEPCIVSTIEVDQQFA